MHMQTFYPTPRRCRWFTMSRAGIVARIPFARRILCVWFERETITC